jgi:hypothetical protein
MQISSARAVRNVTFSQVWDIDAIHGASNQVRLHRARHSQTRHLRSTSFNYEFLYLQLLVELALPKKALLAPLRSFAAHSRIHFLPIIDFDSVGLRYALTGQNSGPGTSMAPLILCTFYALY